MERGSMAVDGRSGRGGEEGFAPLASLLEGFRTGLAGSFFPFD
jgi:hypothetical protein